MNGKRCRSSARLLKPTSSVKRVPSAGSSMRPVASLYWRNQNGSSSMWNFWRGESPFLNEEKRVQHVKSHPLQYRFEDTQILVGKNNLQNEQLVRTSDPNATWMHAKGIPASHVIVNHPNPSRELLAFAAKVAAFHSEASASENVPVDYTHVKHVKKPSGSRPGFVNYFHQHTLYVTPSSDEILPYRTKEDV